ncbi:hypothetical protein AA313_de0204323 [Arthrobotrys entomopaga]|nr:hypothetical protein AA313_de0204323 [Arthrobotrys entomopaga]
MSGQSDHGECDVDTNHKSEILTPLAINVLAIFWKKLARNLIVWKPSKGDNEREHPARKHHRITEIILCVTNDDDSDDLLDARSTPLACYRCTCYLLSAPVSIPAALYKIYIHDKLIEKYHTREMRKRQEAIQKIFDEFAPIASKMRFLRKEEVPGSRVDCDGLKSCGRLSRTYGWDYKFEISNANNRIPESLFRIMMYLGESAHKAILIGEPNVKGDEFLLVNLKYSFPQVDEASGDIVLYDLCEEMQCKIRAPFALEVSKPRAQYMAG